MDKTGALTEGKPKLISIVPTQAGSERDLLRVAGSLEQASEHPLAQAIVAGAMERTTQLEQVGEFQSKTGKGVTGLVGGRQIALGNQALMDELNVPVQELVGQAERLRQEGQTVMFVAVDGQPAGVLGVADPIKASTPEALMLLRRASIQVVMVTGDNRTTARRLPGSSGWITSMLRYYQRKRARASRSCKQRARWWRWPAME